MLPANISIALGCLTIDQRLQLALLLGIAARTLNYRIQHPRSLPDTDMPKVSAYIKETTGLDLPPADFLKPVKFGH